MIDVPVEVKDALRDGRLKKNYRIIVLQSYADLYEIYSSHETFTAPITAKYVLYNNTMPNAFEYVEIIPVSGGEWYSIPCPDDPDKTWLEFQLNAGDVIYVGHVEYAMLGVYDTTNNLEDFTIDNNNLVTESVSIDERMNSGDQIKFGLCEGSSLEFQYFGMENIKGRRLKVFVDVYYGEELPYTIPMGYFIVQKCSRQASTGIVKVTAYNKLMSEYLDAKANDLLLSAFGDDPTKNISVYDAQLALLNEYSITERVENIIPIASGSKSMETLNPNFQFMGTGGAVFGGVNTPLSAYEAKKLVGAITYETMVAVYFTVQKVTIDTNSEYWYLDWIKGDIVTFAQNLREYLVWIITSAMNRADRDSVIRSYVDNDYNLFFRVAVSIKDEQGIYRAKYGGNMLVDPAAKMMSINENLHKGEGRITFWLVKKIGFGESRTIKPADDSRFVVSLTDTYTYTYYTTMNMYESEKETVTTTPNISFSDGDVYDDDITFGDLFQLREPVLSDAEQIEFTVGDIPDVTLRDLISADYELLCQYGQLDRQSDLFSGVELNHSRLFPQETLYPDDELYPDGAQSSANKSMYSKLWADEGNVHKWRNLLITYKGLDEDQQEKDFTIERIINADGTDDYDCSDNWLLRNLVWTEPQIWDFANAMALKMQDMTWFPFEMWCAGLPYVETGDEIEIPMGENSYTSYVLQRQLKGIQNLQDTYINGNLDIF